MRAIPSLKISISGVRGVVGDSLTPTLLARFAEAFGTFLGGGRVVIGRDPRTSGEMVRQAVAAGLLSTGCRIVDIGVCPTPTLQFMVRRLGARGGIAITASHNPPEWNALKFVGADGLFLSAERGRELVDIYHQGDYTKVRGTRMRPVESRGDALDAHVAAIARALGPLDTARRLRVVLDCCNGAGAVVTPRLVEALGTDVVAINATPDGTFPRPAEPLPENLADLRRAVVANGADIGFAQDMDADRLAIVSNEGVAIGEERTLVLAVQYVLSKTPGPVVTNISTTQALDVMANGFGCRVWRTRVGEANVAEGMRRHGAIIGGEGNGGVIYPRINFARDSLVGIALVLHLVAESGQTVSALTSVLPPFEMAKYRLSCPSHRIVEVLRRVREAYAGCEVNLLDGVKVTTPEGWFLLRGSNTEPVLRLTVEAATEEQASALGRKILDQVETWIR
jgi:phosphomannomutase